MTTWTFDAARRDGRRVRGQLEAPSVTDATALLSQRGLLPIVVAAGRGTGASRRRASLRDLATLFQGLAALTGAGVTLAPALGAVRIIVGGALGDALARIQTRVNEGVSFGAALEAEGVLFPAVVVGLVRAGERGAGLNRALRQCAEQLERRAEAAARLRTALAYPVLLLGVGTMSMAVIVVVIVPRFAALLSDAQATLPTATRLLLAASRFLSDGGWLTLLPLGLLAAWFAVQARRNPARWHAQLLELPVIGPLRHAFATARCAGTLGALLAEGSPALAALRVSEATVTDLAVAERLRRTRDRVAQGESLSAAATAERALTPLCLRMAQIGDRAGRLPDLLTHAARIEEQQAEARLRTLSALLEPAVVLLFAALVAFVAAALLQAVYSLRPV